MTDVIYRDGDENVFSWHGFTYYRTKTGKPKKYDREGKKYSITEEEFVETQKIYNETFFGK